MNATVEVLRAHQLQPACLPGGVTVWRCPTCKVDYSAAEARHGAAEAEHQAAALGCVDGWPELEPENAWLSTGQHEEHAPHETVQRMTKNETK